jgi:hypothetical protein
MIYLKRDIEQEVPDLFIAINQVTDKYMICDGKME